MDRKCFNYIFIICLLLCVQTVTWSEEETKPTTLANLFSLGHMLVDTNEDGFADAVNAQLLLPGEESITMYHIAAATEIAARLGFETTAISFPLTTNTGKADEPKPTFSFALLDDVISVIENRMPGVLPYLTEDRGAVILLNSNLERDFRVLIVGANGLGLHAAATNFAGRWPNAWEIWGEKRSTKLDDLEKDMFSVIQELGITDATIKLEALIYEASQEKDKEPDLIDLEKKNKLANMKYAAGEIIDARISVTVSSEKEALKCVDRLKRILTSHRRGNNVNILNYPGIRQLTVRLGTATKSYEVILPRLGQPSRILRRKPDPAAMKDKKEIKGENFDLSDLYSLSGLFADDMGDKIPDRINSRIVISEGVKSVRVADFAARLGLECAGVSIPLAALDLRVDQLRDVSQPVLIGNGQGVQHLIRQGKLQVPELEDGQGYIAIVEKAFNGSNAVAVLGDARGLDKALDYLVSIYPGLESLHPGELVLSKVREQAEGLLTGKSIYGQLASAIAKINEDLSVLRRRTMSDLSFEVFLDKPAPGYQKALSDWLSEELKGVELKVALQGRREAEEIYDETISFVSEVEDVKQIITQEILPELMAGDKIRLDIRLSEPREALLSLKEWAREQFLDKGIGEENLQIRTLCAYKQGFHWLQDAMIPALKGRQMTALLVRIKVNKPKLEEVRMFYSERSRWLSELYPIDEILAPKLGLEIENIIFELVENQEETYRLYVIDADGKENYVESFSPSMRERNYLERFPEWANVLAPTGQISFESNGIRIFERKVKTDAERIWESFQEKLLVQTYEHVMKATKKKPTKDKQPFFHSLTVEAWLSEPNERLGIDEEMISAIESLHEDIYFGALDFFNGMVPRKADKVPEEARYLTRIGAPGSVIPLIHSSPAGTIPKVRMTLLGNAATKNRVKVKWENSLGIDDSSESEIVARKFEDVRISGLIVGPEGLEACYISARTKDHADIGAIALALPFFQKDKIPLESEPLFSGAGLQSIVFDLRAPGATNSLTLAILPAKKKKADSYRTITINTSKILNPKETEDLVRNFNQFSGFTGYQSGSSYQGRAVYSLEILAATPSTHVSRAKLVIAKPTILLIGRQHANEVSSTTHLLKLAESLATTESFKEYRKKLNVIIHPMENPDGAALMEKLIEINPFHMNHASRYTSLGTDVSTQHAIADTLLTEAKVRPMLWKRWLPDILLNCHGYPSHEWVQQFSGYSPYQFRDYWIPRGWFVYLTHLDDPRAPKHREITRELIKYIDHYMSSDKRQLELNKRLYDRYWRWAGRWQPHIVNFEQHGNTMIYSDRTGSVPRKISDRFEVTALEGIPEAMDETPGPEWMETVVNQGAYYLEAHLRLLANGEITVERIEEESNGAVHRKIYRKRPVSVPKQK